MAMKGVIILGFPKCGTTSLMPYLAEKLKMRVARDGGFYTGDSEPVVQRREWCYLPFDEHLEKFNFEFGDPNDYNICFITREPVARCWSGYNAWRHYIPFTYEEYLNITNPDDLKSLKYLGEVNPIKQVDYWHWISPWMERYGSKVVSVYSLEGLINDPDFPWKNTLKPPPISKADYNLTKSKL